MRGLRPTTVRGAVLVVALLLTVASTLVLSGRGGQAGDIVDLESQLAAVELLALRLEAAGQLDMIRAELILEADAGVVEVDTSQAIDVAGRFLLGIAPMMDGPLATDLAEIASDVDTVVETVEGATATLDRLLSIDALVDVICCRSITADGVGGQGWRAIEAMIYARSYTSYHIDTVAGGIYLRDDRTVVAGTITDYMSWNMEIAADGEPLDWDPFEPYIGEAFETDPMATRFMSRPVGEELAAAVAWALDGSAAAGEPFDVELGDVARWTTELADSEAAVIGEAIMLERRSLSEATAEARSAQTLTRWVAIAGFAMAALLVLGTLAAMRRDQIQADLRRNEAQAKLDMLSVVAHELRTPLTAITGFTQFLHSEWRTLDDAQISEFLSLINGQSEELMRLIDDLLTIRRLETGNLDLHPSPVQVREVAERVARSVFREGSRTVRVDADPDLAVMCDPDRMSQILRNLLDNARKYGGPSISVIAGPYEGRCRISVVDDGVGVDPSDVDRIFSRFDQGSAPGRADTGFGLGLSIVKDLAEAMGGDVGYSPATPSGAEFWVDLPVHLDEATMQPSELAG